MQFIKLILITVFLALFYVNSATSKGDLQSDNWVEFCPNSQLCFQKPKSLIPVDVLSIDSITGQLNNENISLIYDLGQYASTFRELSGVSSEPITVDGYQGRLLISQNKMALTIPNISGKLGFAMLIEFKNTIELEQGSQVFKSVKFNLIK